MSECCTTNSPKIIIRPNSCGQATVTAPKVNADTGIGCVPSTPRDLIGQGFLVSFYYYQGSVDQTEFSGPDKNGNTLVATSNSMVFANGVMLDDETYTLTASVLSLSDPCQTDDDIIAVVVFREPEPSEDSGGTGQVSTVNVLTVSPDEDVARPMNHPASLELVTTQFDANWFLNDRIDEVEKKIDEIEIPEASAPFDGDMKGENITNLGNAVNNNDAVSKAVCKGWDMYTLDAANEYCDKEIKKIDIPSIEGLATSEYVDQQDQVVRDIAYKYTDQEIDMLEQRVSSKYTTKEAQSTVDNSQDTKISTLENKVDALEGTVVEAKFKADARNDICRAPAGALQISGPEDFVFDGAVYDFTHTTPFDKGSAATKQYVDAQDEVTLKAAKDYADSLDIPEAISTDGFLTDSGEQQVQAGWKLKGPPKSGEALWTYFSLANAGEIAVNHVRNPTETHHAANRGWVISQSYVSTETPIVGKTISFNSGSGDYTPKLMFSSDDEYQPQSHEKMLLNGNYKSNGGSKSTWSFGYNAAGNYWNYDWAFGSNLTCRYVMGDQNNCVMSIDRTGVDMPNAYIVGDYSLEGVAEEDVESVKAKAREIDIGHRLRELKNILVNLKTALATKSADAQQALLDVLENVEDI